MFDSERFKNFTVYKKNFSSLSELNLFLLDEPGVNRRIFGDIHKINSVNYEKLGLPYKDCVNYLLGGYDFDVPEILEMTSLLDANIEDTSIRKYKKSVVGTRPNVPGYIAGSPLTMYRRERYENIKVIDMYYNIQASWKTEKKEYINRGIITYGLIKLLESSGYKVNLVVFCSSMCDDEMYYYQIGIKKIDEIFRLTEANTFALCAPEMFRRIIFRVVESTPFNNVGWGSNYGVKVDEDILKDYLSLSPNSILILNPKEMGISGVSLEDDAEKFINKLNLSDKININSDNVKLAFKKEQ